MDTDTHIFQDTVAEFKASPVLHYARLHLHVALWRSPDVSIPWHNAKAAERAANRVAGIKTLILEIRQPPS